MNVFIVQLGTDSYIFTLKCNGEFTKVVTLLKA